MPLYEYYCTDCRTKFDALRPISKADDPIPCKNCEGDHTSRALSLFATFSSKGESQREHKATASSGGGCCGRGGCGCAH